MFYVKMFDFTISGLHGKVCDRTESERMEMSQVSDTSRRDEKVRFCQTCTHRCDSLEPLRREWWMVGKAQYRRRFSSHRI